MNVKKNTGAQEAKKVTGVRGRVVPSKKWRIQNTTKRMVKMEGFKKDGKVGNRRGGKKRIGSR